jgi:hypothetical protein
MAEMPELYEDLFPFWKAFSSLSGSRPTGFSVGAIPISEIISYLDLMEIHNFEDRTEYYKWIKFLDNEFLSIKHEKQESKTKPPKNRR